jgi:hypothetical protein
MANPNPSPETRFRQGNPGGGKTSEQKRLEYESAEMAAALRHKMLSVITEKAETDELKDILDILDANTLKLFKDSEDRAHGTPKATNELSGPNGGAIPVSEVKYTIHDPAKNAD